MEDLPAAGQRDEESFVVWTCRSGRGGSLERVEVSSDVHATDKVFAFAQGLPGNMPHAGHADHAQRDIAAIGQLHAYAPLRQRGCRSIRHEIRNDVHRLAGGSALHQRLDVRPELIDVAPVVELPTVGHPFRRHERTGFGTGRVIRMGVGEVGAIAKVDQLACGDSLLQ